MEQVKKPRVLTKVRDGIQVFKMGSRLEYYSPIQIQTAD
jgi:hypothetical protein